MRTTRNSHEVMTQPLPYDAKDTDELLAACDAWLDERERLRVQLEAEVELLTSRLVLARRALAMIGVQPTAVRVRDPNSATAAIIEYVSEHPGCTSTEIYKATGNATTCSVLATRTYPKLRREKINGLWRYYPIAQERVSPQATDVSNEAKEK